MPRNVNSEHLQSRRQPPPATLDLGSSAFDEDDFRTTLGHFCTGVAVIAAFDNGPVGFTCQSFSSLSLDPPMVTFAVSNTSGSWPRIRRSGAFCASILGVRQAGLARTFSTPQPDKFAGVDWTAAPVTGSPRLDGAIAWVDCVLTDVFGGGDHKIVVGRVVALNNVDGNDPLLYFRGQFGCRDSRPVLDCET
jgi:flavin reductase (DIM6/NTAB) family NADH-FMN oxidoreductase RutF